MSHIWAPELRALMRHKLCWSITGVGMGGHIAHGAVGARMRIQAVIRYRTVRGKADFVHHHLTVRARPARSSRVKALLEGRGQFAAVAISGDLLLILEMDQFGVIVAIWVIM